jgi:hypothetical protein
MTIPTISRRCAPRAILTLISAVRWETLNEGMPWMPIPASSNATIANPASTLACADR